MPFATIRRPATGALAALVVALALLPAAASPVAAGGSTGFLNTANGYRADANLGPVAYHSVINTITVERGRQLARAGELGHDFEYLKRRFAQEGICWRSFGEIVAWNGSGDFSAFGKQWFNSTVHRDIMLGDFTHASGSRETVGDRTYGVMVFVKLCNASTPVLTTSGFTDIAGSPFKADIEWLVEQGITTGCAPTLFCPTDRVSRGQMATFLVRAFDLPTTSVDYFTDDESSSHEQRINSSRAASVTSGCGRGVYCPGSSITRAQVAIYLSRALGLPSTTKDYFSDDNGMAAEPAINRLAAAGITTGCGAGKFCPRDRITRDQMAAFLRRALD